MPNRADDLEVATLAGSDIKPPSGTKKGMEALAGWTSHPGQDSVAIMGFPSRLSTHEAGNS